MRNLITVFSELQGFTIIWATSEASSFLGTSNGDLIQMFIACWRFTILEHLLVCCRKSMQMRLLLNVLSYSSQEMNLSSLPKITGLNISRIKGTLNGHRIFTDCSQLRDILKSAYGAFVKFFAEQVKDLGVTGALEKYIFDPEVNKNGIDMLSRVVSGA